MIVLFNSVFTRKQRPVGPKRGLQENLVHKIQFRVLCGTAFSVTLLASFNLMLNLLVLLVFLLIAGVHPTLFVACSFR